MFGPASPAHYLTGTLEKKGELLMRYYAVAHEGLAERHRPAQRTRTHRSHSRQLPRLHRHCTSEQRPEGQILGKGCVYPIFHTDADGPAHAKHLTWKAYVEGIGEGRRRRQPVPIRPPARPTQAPQKPEQRTSYQTWRNPFVYFSSVAWLPGMCFADDVGMSALKGDLAMQRAPPTSPTSRPDHATTAIPVACAPGKPAG